MEDELDLADIIAIAIGSIIIFLLFGACVWYRFKKNRNPINFEKEKGKNMRISIYSASERSMS